MTKVICGAGGVHFVSCGDWICPLFGSASRTFHRYLFDLIFSSFPCRSTTKRNWIQEGGHRWCWRCDFATCNRSKCCSQPNAMQMPNTMAGQVGESTVIIVRACCEYWYTPHSPFQLCRRPFARAMRPYWRQYWRCVICSATFNVSHTCRNCCRSLSMHPISMWKWNGSSRHGVSMGTHIYAQAIGFHSVAWQPINFIKMYFCHLHSAADVTFMPEWCVQSV